MKTELRNGLLLLLGVLLGANRVWAEAPDPRWSVGVAGIYRSQPYRGVDDDWLVFPSLRYEGERLRLRGPELSYRMLELSGVRLDLLAKMRFDGYQAKDSRFLQGMADRHPSLDFGLRAGVRWKRSVIEAVALHDTLSQHEGSELALNWRLPLRKAGWNILPEIGISRLSPDLANYYYGVRSSEARPGRFVYRVGAAYNAHLALVLQKPLGPRWSAFLRAELTRLDAALHASPIVDRRTMSSALLGIDYALGSD